MKKQFKKILKATLLLTTLAEAASAAFAGEGVAKPEVIAKIPVRNPAFLAVFPGVEPGTQELYVSSFGMTGGDKIQSYRINSTDITNLGQLKPRVLADRIPWPNLTYEVPDEVAGPHHIAVGTGFLVPGRTTGGVYIIEKVTGASTLLTKPKKDFFYHKVVWADMNQDGLLDIITARAKKPMFGPSSGELLWLEQPKIQAPFQKLCDGSFLGVSKEPWKEHLIAVGPDVNFEVLDLNQDGKHEIIASEFFTRQLTIHWQSSESEDHWQSKVLDNQTGAAFDVITHDLNGDGKKDLVVTNHEGNASASVFAYEIPENYLQDIWTKHVLLTGITTEVKALNAASPGSPVIWEVPGQKPHILVAGDGSSKVHWLAPKSAFVNDWSYEERIALDTDSTIGTMALSDINQDGKKELFVPAYDTHHVYVLSLPEIP